MRENAIGAEHAHVEELDVDVRPRVIGLLACEPAYPLVPLVNSALKSAAAEHQWVPTSVLMPLADHGVLGRTVVRASGERLIRLPHHLDVALRHNRQYRCWSVREQKRCGCACLPTTAEASARDTPSHVSKKNVEIARAASKAAMASETGRPDQAALNRLFDREHEFVSFLVGVEGRSYSALDGYARYRDDMDDAWEEWRMDVEDLIDAGGDTVVAVGHFRARGRTSGAPVDRRVGIVYTLRNGRVWRTQTYLDLAEAFAAVGLPEQTGV